MRKPTICICENKGADQLRGNRESDHRLCFRYSDSTIPLLLKSEISSFYLFSVLVQAGLCRTCSETTLLVFPRDGSYVSSSLQIDTENNMMIATAKSVDHPDYPPTSDYVRVGKYTSRMVIKPHRTFDEKGFDYVMSYFDDPQLYVPYWAVNKMTVSSEFEQQYIPNLLTKFTA